MVPWLFATLLLSAVSWFALSSPAAAQGNGAAALSAARTAARELAGELMENLRVGSTVVVRPLAAGHTGLPESAAKRIETLIVNALDVRLPQDMNVTLLRGRDVLQIFRSLDESSFAGGSEELLESVLKAARADTVLACEPAGADPASLEIHCSITYGRVVCPGGGEIRSCATVDVEDVRNLGSAVVSFPWRNPDEHLKYVFTELAWKLAGAVGLDESDEVELVGECPDDRSALTRSVTKKLRHEMRRVQRQRVGWRKVGGKGRRFTLRWSVMEWGDDRYELSADLYRQGTDRSTFETGDSTHIEVSSLPGNVRLVPCGDPDPNPIPGPESDPDPDPDPNLPPPPSCGEDATVYILSDGITLADWVFLARTRLEHGDHVNLMVEAKRHLREYCEWRPLVEVLEAAVSGIAGELRVAIKTSPREGLDRLSEVEASAGRQPALLLLWANGHERLGEYSAAEAVYVEWLNAASPDHGKRAEVLTALYRVRDLENASSAEESLRMTRTDRTWVRWALMGEQAAGPGQARDAFGEAVRDLIRTWQAGRGLKPTGHLTTRGELDALIAEGRQAERAHRELVERQADDAAFAEARRLNTEAGFLTYLKRGGRHEAQARELLFEARWPAGRKFDDCLGCPEMVVVPAGSFMMGSPAKQASPGHNEGPMRRVTIGERLAVGVYEVTFSEWDTCRRGGGCSYRPDDRGWGRGDRPVIEVSWNDANEYVRWLSQVTRAEYRLLSESEWEYAARSGTSGPFHFGSTISPEQANYDGNYTYGSGRKGRYRMRTVPVGTFPANAFGLHDVHGNVREWVEDCWHGSYRGAPSDGRAWTAGGDCDYRMVRGGSWTDGPGDLRSADRDWYETGYRSSGVGFRVARTLD